MRVDNVHSNQTFGKILVQDKQTMDFLKKRLRTKSAFNKFTNLVRSQRDNRYNIFIGKVFVDNREHIDGYIFDGLHYYKPYRENYLNTFLNPLRFLKSLCNDADKLSAR